MGSVVRRVTKPFRKLIPKEIKPALPYVAAFYGQPYLAKGLGAVGTFAASNPAVTKALIAAGTAATTQEDPNLLRTAALAAAPDVLSGGLEKLGTAGKIPFGPQPKGSLSGILKSGQQLALSGADKLQPTDFVGATKLIGTQTAVDAAAQLAEIQQDEIDRYNRELQEQGIINKVKRRQSIYDIYINAGYEPDYVNSVLDKYGYASGGIVYLANGGLESDAEEMLKRLSRGYRGAKRPMKAMFGKKKKKKKESVGIEPNERDEITVNIEGSEGDDGFLQSLQTAREGIEMAYKPPIGSIQPVPMLKFAKGGEVEIEEETDDLGIMDFMKDQGIPYGEMASDINNERLLEQLYEQFLDMGLSPEDAAKAAYDAFNRMSKRPREGIMQMASGYKTDIEEMYEQYVFEMEEMGLEPMSFSQFVAREKAGMKDGGITFEEYLEGRGKEEKMKNRQKLLDDYEEFLRRQKVREQKQEAKDGGILKAANGGTPGARYSFLINKQKQGILSPDEEEELLMLEMTFADEGGQGKADGGIMEKDMRGGGFIPEGSKERADDVPARLSKNEFVMTADAVRAAGGGSVNKGAKRMYDMMYSLEGKV